MSLLHQDSPNQIDDAAKGEEFTKGTSHRIWATVIAAVVVSIAIAIYVIAGEKPPMADGEMVEVWAHPLHSITPGYDANGAPQTQESFEHVLVFAHVKLENKSDKPLFLHRIETNVTLSDGIHTAYAATLSDYDRVFIAYPDLAPYHDKGLSPLDTTIDPGKAQEGTFVSSFRVNKQEWDARKDLSFDFNFRYQPSLKLTPHTAVTER